MVETEVLKEALGPYFTSALAKGKIWGVKKDGNPYQGWVFCLAYESVVILIFDDKEKGLAVKSHVSGKSFFEDMKLTVATGSIIAMQIENLLKKKGLIYDSESEDPFAGLDPSMPHCVWHCTNCGAWGYFQYEEGQSPGVARDSINDSHSIKGCGDRHFLEVYDHTGRLRPEFSA